jgi:hypothetical protein
LTQPETVSNEIDASDSNEMQRGSPSFRVQNLVPANPTSDPTPLFHSNGASPSSRYPEVMEGYMRAREAQMVLRADEILSIADNASNDWMDQETKSGRLIRVVDHEHIKRSDIRIRTRMWLMTRFAPKTFGERLQLDAVRETREAVAAQSDQERLEGALALIARAKRRVAEAFASGEISEADFEDASGDEER